MLIQIIKNRTGKPKKAVNEKKYGYPIKSTQPPAYPAINFGIKSIIELNKAYCVAVNFIEVNPDK